MSRDWNDIINQDFKSEINNALKAIELIDNNEIWGHVSLLARGGKIVRAELIRRLISSTGCEVSSQAIIDASSLELIHLSTLIHDDIIDDGKTRRHFQTLNDKYDNNIALLVGNIVKDYALSISSSLSRDILNKASLDVNYGQYLETLARTDSSLYIRNFFLVAIYKSARMFRYCVSLSSMHSDQTFPPNASMALELMAISYQAVDDWLDKKGSASFVGKNISQDTKNNVHSFLDARWGDSFQTYGEKIDFFAEQTLNNAMLCFLNATKNFPDSVCISELPEQHQINVIALFCEEITTMSLALCDNNQKLKEIIKTYMENLVRDIYHPR